MDWVGRVPRIGIDAGAITARDVLWALVAAGAVGVAVGVRPNAPTAGYALTAPVLVGGALIDREGLGALVVWIVGGAALGAAVGYGAHGLVSIPLTQFGAAGMGAALGGGLGALVNFVSVGETEREPEPGVTVDMGQDEAPEPRPADLFEEHPDPVLYVADEGGGPVVRAANEAFGETFDLPTTTLAGAPLADALLATEGAGVVDSLAAGDPVDSELEFDTTDGEVAFRVRSVGNPADGYVLFTPVGGA